MTVGGVAYFLANDAVRGFEDFRGDGTGAGRRIVTDINPGSASSLPLQLVNVNGTLFFQAKNECAARSYGQVTARPPAPCLFATFNRAEGSNPEKMVNPNGTLFFFADDRIHGIEPCVLNPSSFTASKSDKAAFTTATDVFFAPSLQATVPAATLGCLGPWRKPAAASSPSTTLQTCAPVSTSDQHVATTDYTGATHHHRAPTPRTTSVMRRKR
jgi:ELWxxDGT repeat protein